MRPDRIGRSGTRASVLVALIGAAAVAAPVGAQAATGEQLRPALDRPAPMALTASTGSNGFDWRDAGIGAGAMSLLCLGAGAAIVGRRGRGKQPVAG